MTKQASVIFALDFDGVLVDSAAETGLAGLKAAKILFPTARWLLELEANPIRHEAILSRFREIRPCLETGWEAALLMKLLADEELTTDEIMNDFQSKLKHNMLNKLHLTKENCNKALRKARDDWIKIDAQDWVASHDFYEGACAAVRKLLEDGHADRVYVITTKATEYAERLLEKQGLFGEGKIAGDHIFGLGSGPKEQVLAEILEKTGDEATIAVMVEDNLLTLEKIMSTDSVSNRVLPVLASWGYNTPAQRKSALKNHFVVLNADDSSSLATVLENDKVLALMQDVKAR